MRTQQRPQQTPKQEQKHAIYQGPAESWLEQIGDGTAGNMAVFLTHRITGYSTPKHRTTAPRPKLGEEHSLRVQITSRAVRGSVHCLEGIVLSDPERPAFRAEYLPSQAHGVITLLV